MADPALTRANAVELAKLGRVLTQAVEVFDLVAQREAKTKEHEAAKVKHDQAMTQARADLATVSAGIEAAKKAAADVMTKADLAASKLIQEAQAKAAKIAQDQADKALAGQKAIDKALAEVAELKKDADSLRKAIVNLRTEENAIATRVAKAKEAARAAFGG